MFLLANEPHDIELAYFLLESFYESLTRLGRIEHVPARLMLRPALLRIESFFTQASGLIQTGRAEGNHSPSTPL